MNNEKRRDNKGRLLLMGECQEKDGSYTYRYTDKFGNRKKLSSWRLTKADPQPPRKKFKMPLRDQEKEIQSDIADGICSNGMSVNELVERYLSLKTGVKHNTEANYKFVQNVLRKEEFGYRSIDKIRLSDAKLFLIKLQDDGRGYSSIHAIRGVLRPAFQMAVDDDMIRKNPFEFQIATVIVNDSVTREAITREEERNFLKFVREDKHFSRYYEGIYILFKTGMRISEFVGLTLSDIDLKNRTIDINHQLQRMRDGTKVIETTKTNAGTRVIPMTDDVYECFKKIIQNRVKPEVEPMIDGYTGFLYFDQNGLPMVAMHWEHYFKHICQKYNKIYRVQMPKVTPHVCRHTYCSNMAKSGINPKTLQYLMGHSDIGVTLNTYTHLGLEDAKQEVCRVMKEMHRAMGKPGKNGGKIVNF
ncbi:MAG: site-specific integrase [Lachnospiraceae bacterium]|nr:site-specific integrase [Lachnospiraceae bacterium]